MKAKNVYSIKLSDIDSDCPNCSIWKNNEVVNPDDLTLDEIKIIADELFDYHLIFREIFDSLISKMITL